MKFLVTATPTQVPLLCQDALRRTREWHEAHARLGCLMLLQDSHGLAGLLEAPDEAELRRSLETYPDRGCYEWRVEAAMPVADVCAHEMQARMTPRRIRPMQPEMQGSLFPGWMTRTLPR